MSTQDTTLDPAEVARFSAIAHEWWDPNGKFRPLHQLGPARMAFIRDAVVRGLRLDAPATSIRPLTGQTVLDIGCGGGLVSEPLARLGATVTGIDPSNETIAAADAHAKAQNLDITYLATRAETLAASGQTFDCVVCLEVVEHVPDVAAFLAIATSLIRPGGVLVLSTINRTLKSYALAIVGAEYILRWLPIGTHQWERFVTPDELSAHTIKLGLTPETPRGMVFNPLRDEWSLSSDTDVNYLLAATKPVTANASRPT